MMNLFAGFVCMIGNKISFRNSLSSSWLLNREKSTSIWLCSRRHEKVLSLKGLAKELDTRPTIKV